MSTLGQVLSFIQGPDFFWYHGYGLTAIWVLAVTVAILAKKINIYLHALLFWIVDMTTIFLVGGAFYRYLINDRFSQWTQWTLVKQLHIFGGIFIVLLVTLQHIGGVSTLLSASKRNPQHKQFAFWVTNLARTVVVLGWIMKGGDTTNLFYVSAASAFLLVASFYTAFIKKHTQTTVNPQVQQKAKSS